ncbi:unnamed protein product [Mesocestoides corti]|uniref:Uncharacterized protein n=1 Tax=Mesocestoides corti TaxID=53468 RepID=A0A0R3U297_MESCO|nr:unnamed protein product [Mesocestoides corti]
MVLLGDSLSPVKTPGTPYSVSVLRKSLHQRERFFMSSPTPLKVRNENNQITPLRPSAVLSPPFEKSRDSQSGRTSLDTPVNQISPSKKPKKLCEFPWTELAKKRGFTWETYASASKPSFEVVTKTPSRQGALRMQTPSKVQRFGQPSSLSSKQTPCRFASKVESVRRVTSNTPATGVLFEETPKPPRPNRVKVGALFSCQTARSPSLERDSMEEEALETVSVVADPPKMRLQWPWTEKAKKMPFSWSMPQPAAAAAAAAATSTHQHLPSPSPPSPHSPSLLPTNALKNAMPGAPPPVAASSSSRQGIPWNASTRCSRVVEDVRAGPGSTADPRERLQSQPTTSTSTPSGCAYRRIETPWSKLLREKGLDECRRIHAERLKTLHESRRQQEGADTPLRKQQPPQQALQDASTRSSRAQEDGGTGDGGTADPDERLQSQPPANTSTPGACTYRRIETPWSKLLREKGLDECRRIHAERLKTLHESRRQQEGADTPLRKLPP